MRKLIALALAFIHQPAWASYTDGFFAVLVMTMATPVLLLGVITTLVYCRKKRFYDRSFTILYSAIWLAFTVITVITTSLVSLSGSDNVSAVLIFTGLSTYYLAIALPAVLQYRNNSLAS